MTASEQLALAHERMTPDDIRAHALAMASVIESNHELITCLLDVLANYEKRIDASDQTRINTQIALRQIASMYAAGRKREAREFLTKAAAVEIVRADDPKVDRSLYRSPTEAWPDIFNPKGTANGG